MKKEKIHNITTAGFKTPDNYFDSFEAQLLKRIDDDMIIDTIESPGFTLPTNYFDTVESNILETLEPKTDKPVIQFKPRTTFYYFAGIAASFVLLFSLVFNNKAITFNTIDTVSIENYLYQEDYSNEEFATLFKVDDMSESDFIDVNISDATLNDYIESIDTEDFILD
jgi:hypothetical protein